MLDFLEILDRTLTGNKIEEREYDMKIFEKCSALIKEIPNFKFYQETIVPSDNSLADEIFELGLKLAIDVGAYCLDTKRIVKFTETEIKERLREIPEVITVGSGKDARRMFCRDPDDDRMPFVYAATACPFEEKYHPIITKCIAELPIDAYNTPNILEFEGRVVQGPPLSVWANRKIVEWARAGLRRGGKPGLHLFNYPLLTRSDLLIGVLDDEHIRKGDGISCTHLPELYKIQYDNITASQLAHDYGCFIHETTSGFPGGFAGGYEGAIIENIAAQILGQMVTNFDYNLVLIIPTTNANLMSSPESLWALSLIMQSVSRNSKIKIQEANSSASEPGTEQSYLERACSILTNISSGITATRPCTRNFKPTRVNLGGPFEIKWAIELANAAKGMKRSELNEIVKKISSTIPKEKLINPPRGKSFDEAYDPLTFYPKEETKSLYQKMETKMEGFGISLY